MWALLLTYTVMLTIMFAFLIIFINHIRHKPILMQTALDLINIDFIILGYSWLSCLTLIQIIMELELKLNKYLAMIMTTIFKINTYAVLQYLSYTIVAHYIYVHKVHVDPFCGLSDHVVRKMVRFVTLAISFMIMIAYWYLGHESFLAYRLQGNYMVFKICSSEPVKGVPKIYCIQKY